MTRKAKPIIFSTPMVQAILEGRKTMTRRVPGKQHPYQAGDILWVRETFQRTSAVLTYWEGGEPVDESDPHEGFRYFADGKTHFPDGFRERHDEFYSTSIERDRRWKPGIHMPREAARIFLRVTASRPERLADISVEDAIAEGCIGIRCEHPNIRIGVCTDCYNHGWLESPTTEFFELWHRLNGKRDGGIYAVKHNPWVWAYTFERISKEEAEA